MVCTYLLIVDEVAFEDTADEVGLRDEVAFEDTADEAGDEPFDEGSVEEICSEGSAEISSF